MSFSVRPATPADAGAITRIYTEGILDRVGTFETRERTTDDVAGWFDGRHPIVVVESAAGEQGQRRVGDHVAGGAARASADVQGVDGFWHWV